ncbi:hypothetical protein ACQP3J_26690, partial [Escherichia coli]
MDAELPLCLNVSYTTSELRFSASLWMWNCHLASVELNGTGNSPLVYLGQQMDTELPPGLGVSEPVAELGSWAGRWTQNFHWASACQGMPKNSDQGTHHWVQMTLNSDDKCKQIYSLAHLRQRIDTELPLCLDILETISELRI